MIQCEGFNKLNGLVSICQCNFKILKFLNLKFYGRTCIAMLLWADMHRYVAMVTLTVSKIASIYSTGAIFSCQIEQNMTYLLMRRYCLNVQKWAEP